MSDGSAVMVLGAHSHDRDAENVTGAYGVREKPGFTDIDGQREAMASGMP